MCSGVVSTHDNNRNRYIICPASYFLGSKKVENNHLKEQGVEITVLLSDKLGEHRTYRSGPTIPCRKGNSTYFKILYITNI